MNPKYPLYYLQRCMLIFMMTALNTLLLGQQDTLYYNTQWALTVKDSAAFFRPPSKKEGELFRVQDYYVSGQLQMNALSKSTEKDIWQGRVVWYNEDGSIFQEGEYKNNRLEGEFITFMDNEKLVATYADNRFVSGKRNMPYGVLQMYFEKAGDTLYEVLYEKDIKGIREEHYGTKEKYRFYSKYYDDKGILIGERKILPNNYYKGIEVFYYHSPMRVKEIALYPFGKLLISSTYYPSGQIREEVSQEPNWSKKYYSKGGDLLGKIKYQLDGDRLKPYEGTEIYFVYGQNIQLGDLIRSTRSYQMGLITSEEVYHENGNISSKTTYKDGSKELQISFNEKGEEINRMVYKDYRPFEGTEIQIGRTATYKTGELVEELTYFMNSKIPMVSKTKTLETYYDISGEVLGTLKLTDDSGYSTPFEGQRFSMDYRNGDLVGIEDFKEGVRVKQTRFRKRETDKDETKTFKSIEEFDSEGYKKIKETKFYSNGSKQSEITYKGYTEVFGLFYDETEKQIGAYDYEKKDGTRYVFFADSDYIEVMEELKEGKQQRLKKYNYGKTAVYGRMNPVLEQDVDVDCCATYYSIEGEEIAKLTFKNQIPWEGTAYDTNSRKKYTIKGGKRNGTYQKFDYNQQVIEEGQFVNDKEEGIFKYYDYQYDLQRTENFTSGILNGKSSFYDKSGNVVSELIYKDGRPFEGKKLTSYGFSTDADVKIYENGMLKKQVVNEEEGKSITMYTSEKESNTVMYHKDSDIKRLRFGTMISSLHGTVIKYDKEGKEQHRALFDNGKMESGTIHLKPRYQDRQLLYMIVDKESDKLKVRFINYDNQVVLSAEEIIIPGSRSNYLEKLDINLDYLTSQRLY